MVAPGPKPRPRLEVVREGNPGKRKVKEGLKLPPSAPAEPVWEALIPQVGREARVVLERARAEWASVVPKLDARGVLNDVDAEVLTDYCVCVARIEQCERELTMRGLVIEGERGWQKNGAATIANQYRSQLRFYVGELGLSPSARGRIEAPDGDDEESPFD